MVKILKSAAFTAACLILVTWATFIAVRHAGGDIILTSDLGWRTPHVRPVFYGLVRGDGAYKQIKEQGYWYGGDVIYKGVPDWVFIIPCPRWMGNIGGDWYGVRGGYSRWLPNLH